MHSLTCNNKPKSRFFFALGLNQMPRYIEKTFFFTNQALMQSKMAPSYAVFV